LALATAAAAAGVSAPHAQEAPAAASAPIEEVVVTGSRLLTPNEVSISPITSVSATALQATGLTRVEDVLNNLPMVFAGESSSVSNGGDGTATVDLRDLGPQRTLVLVNGRRLGPGRPDGRNFADINQVPAALIDRVDILTGGASSVYGADAVGGVVNFILNTHFQGVKIDAGYNFHEHKNRDDYAKSLLIAAGDAVPDSTVRTGFGKDVSILMGSNFADNKGNATVYATFDTLGPVLQAKYDYSACTLQGVKGGGFKCGGSVIAAHGYFAAYANTGSPLFQNTVDPATGAFRGFTNADRYNYGPSNYYQVPQDRWTGGAFLNYDVNAHVNTYAEVMAMRITSTTQVAPSGNFSDFGAVFIPCANPLLTAQEAAAICSPANQLAQGNPTETVNGTAYPGLNVYAYRRNVEGGGRQQTFNNDSIRTLMGVRGDFANAWKYDVSAQRSTVLGTSFQSNYLNNTGIHNATNVLPGPGGVATCASVLDKSDPKCVPWNIWVPGGVTPAALKYLAIPLTEQGDLSEDVVSGNVTGDLGNYGLKLPTADHGLQVNFGTEYRAEEASFRPDLAEQQGVAAGAGGKVPPVSGGFHVWEAFTEMRLPLAEHIVGAESLALEGGYRYSSYTLGFNTNTYKAGLEWKPVQDLLLRGSYQRAVRAPNIAELFSPQTVALDFTADPCAGPAPKYSPAQCASSGVTATQYGKIQVNPSSQYNGLIGGNPLLQPESADTYSIGFVLQPRFVPNLSVSVDYYDIKIKNTIHAVGGGVILAQCIQTGDPAFCSLVHRNQTGSLWNSQSGYVQDTTINTGALSTKGLDIKAAYRQSLAAFGSLSFALEGTKTNNRIQQPLTGGPSYDCVGFEGGTCGAPLPSWRHVLNATWSTPWDAWDLTLRWRYLGSVNSDVTSSNPLLNQGLTPPNNHNIPSFNYIDLSSSFALGKIVRLQLGVNNLFDKDPPRITDIDCPNSTSNPGAPCNGNTYPGSWDALGRYVFAHLSATF
jgi:outer membrane receptor protein involved in Fe transport